jgi:acetolactate synthase-1/2/3 large subunit
MDKLTGARVLAATLAASGVEYIFMQEHGETRAISEAAAQEESLKVISPVSEASCVPMADGYTRFSGRPAAAVTAGGGHLLNQVIGVASAWADKSPVISIGVCRETSKSASPIFDREAWDQAEAFSAVTRWTATIREWAEIPHVVRRGLREAMSGRMGPVHIEAPVEILEREESPGEELALDMRRASYHSQAEAPPMGEPDKVRAAADLLVNAKRPLIFAGGGVVKSGAAREINLLAQKLMIPITSTMGGMGAAFPDNPAYMGPASYLSGEAFHAAIRQADVVLAMGCCFSGLDGLGIPPLWSEKIKFIQVNVDPEDIAINPPAEIAIIGDARQVALQMLELVNTDSDGARRKPWLEKLQRLNREHIDRIMDEAHRPWEMIHPALVPTIINDIAGDSDAAVVLDGGNTCLWTGMLIPVPGPRRGFFPTGMGTLGLSIPVAIGIKAAAGDKPVIIVSGDGAFLYNVQELETIVKYDLPIVMVVVNDSAWNMIRAGQAMTGPVYGTDLPGQDYAEVAKSFGIEGRRVTNKEDIGPAFEQAFNSGKAALIDVVTDPDSIPDSIISFARAEFDGTSMPPGKLIRALWRGKFNLDVRGRNLIKFIRKTM